VQKSDEQPKAQAAAPAQPAQAMKPWMKELKEVAAVEVRNGNGARHLARRTRTSLSKNGYHVRCIGNHWNFGAKQTVILYRPEAIDVAQLLGSDFFPFATFESTERLRRGTDIKIVLGADVSKKKPQPQLAGLARK
jgi:hypothetical protein